MAGEGQPREGLLQPQPQPTAETRRLFSLWEIWGSLLGGMGGRPSPRDQDPGPEHPLCTPECPL